ncbi:MAG: DUF2269 family protein [Chloroflexi bacterium]|nr:DUF2269 family protein [Chloroflexota bacterium]
MSLFTVFLLAHILGAIVAFGPTFAFPLIGAMGGKEPMHANFASRVSHAIAKRITWPLALLQGVTGIALIITGNVDLTKALWLDVAIVLYLGSLGLSYFVLTPRVVKVIEMTSTPPPPPAPGAAPAGPPPALVAAVKAVRQGGMIMSILLVLIITLMVTRPF